MQIANVSNEGCTLGFNVTTQTYLEVGFLTAAHCNTGPAWSGGTGSITHGELAYKRRHSSMLGSRWIRSGGPWAGLMEPLL